MSQTRNDMMQRQIFKVNLRSLETKHYRSAKKVRNSGAENVGNNAETLASMSSLASPESREQKTPERKKLQVSNSLGKLLITSPQARSISRKGRLDSLTTTSKNKKLLEGKGTIELSSPTLSAFTPSNDITRISANFSRRYRSPVIRSNDSSGFGVGENSASGGELGTKNAIKRRSTNLFLKRLKSNNENSDESLDRSMNLLEEGDWVNFSGEKGSKEQTPLHIFRALPIENTLELNSKNLLDKYIELKNNNDKETADEFLRRFLFDLLVSVKESLELRVAKHVVYTHLGKIVGICDALKETKLRLKILALVSKVFRGFGDCQFSLRYLRQYRSLSHTYQLYKEEIKALKWLALLCQDLKQYKKSLNYLKKLLKLCWKHDDEENELGAFDLIGKQYYYMGDMKRAYVFREKMMSGQCVSKDSKFRKMGIDSLNRKEEVLAQEILNKSRSRSFQKQYLRPNLKEESDDDSLDLELLYVNPEDLVDLRVFNTKMERQQIIRFSHHFYGHAKHNNVLEVFFDWQKGINQQRELGPEISPDFVRPGPVRKASGTKTILSHLTTNRDIKNYSNQGHQSIEGVVYNSPGCEVVPRKALNIILRDIDVTLKKRKGTLT